VLPVLTLVGLIGLAQDLGDLAVEPVQVAVGLVGGVGGHLVPSRVTVPTRTMPSAAHSLSEATGKPVSACWWRTRKRAMVTWSGV
jgi:hypothetical protein